VHSLHRCVCFTVLVCVISHYLVVLWSLLDQSRISYILVGRLDPLFALLHSLWQSTRTTYCNLEVDDSHRVPETRPVLPPPREQGIKIYGVTKKAETIKGKLFEKEGLFFC
jgi:hypothetical protein